MSGTRVFSTIEIARALGVTRWAVRKWILNGDLRARRHDGPRGIAYRVSAANLQMFLRSWQSTTGGANRLARLAVLGLKVDEDGTVSGEPSGPVPSDFGTDE